MADLSAFGLTEEDIAPTKKQSAVADLSAFGLTEQDLAVPERQDLPKPLPAIEGKEFPSEMVDFPSRALTGQEAEMLRRDPNFGLPQQQRSALGEAYGQVLDMASAFNRGVVGLVDVPVTLFNVGSQLLGSDVRAASLASVPAIRAGTKGGFGPEGLVPQGLETAAEFLGGSIAGGGAAQGLSKMLTGAEAGTRAAAVQKAAEGLGKMKMNIEARAALGGGMASSAVAHSAALSDSTAAQLLAPVLGGTLAAAPGAAAKTAARGIPGQQKKTRAAEVALASADDPDAAVRELTKRNVADVGAAAATGDAGIATLARSLARENPVFEGQLNDQFVMSQMAIQRELDNLFTPSGRPVSPTAAQDFIKRNADELMRQMDDRVTSALQKVQSTAMLGRGKIDDITLSRQAKVHLETAMREVGKQRDIMWKMVGKEVPIDTAPLRQEAVNVVNEARKATALPRRVLEQIIGNKIQKTTTGYKVTNEPVTGGYGAQEPVGELIEQRSNLLAELRAESKDAIATKQAPIFNRLQGAVIDAIDGSPVPPGVDPDAYRKAAAFTRRMHEVFDQGIIGRVLTSNTKAGEAVLAEKTLSTLLAGGREAQAAGARELTNIALMRDQIGSQPIFQSDILNDAQSYIASKFQREVTNPEDAANFMLENESAIKWFPQLRKTLTEAMRAIGIQSGKIDRLQAGKKAIERSAFTKLGGMSGKQAVSSILSQQDPGKFARQVRQLVGRDRDALRGMQRDIADMVLERSLTVTNTVSQLGEQVSKGALNKVIRQLDPVIDAFYSSEMKGNLKLIQEEVSKVQALRAQTPGRLEIPRSILGDLIARASGAHIASKMVAGSGAGPSLIAAKAGSEAGRSLVFAIPESATRGVLEAAMLDRQLLLKLLKRGVASGKDQQLLTDALKTAIKQDVGAQAAEQFEQNVELLERNNDR